VNGEPIQVIHPQVTTSINVVDLQQLLAPERETLLEQLTLEEAIAPFNLANTPLIRCSSLQISAREYVLLLTMHHIVSDGWSMGVLISELSSLYAAFCVGEPWNAHLVNQKAGYTALVTGQLWKDHPEKAFTMRKDWVDKNPKAAKAVLQAVLEAQQWCDKPDNVQEMCEIISQDKWLKVPVEDIIGRSSGKIDFGTGEVIENFPYSMKFWRDNASYPYKSHDLWFLTEDIRWGYIPAKTDTKKIIDEVNREDLWKEAAQALGVPAAEIPTSTSRGVETFFDGVKFDPENPQAYLDGLKIKAIKA
jgi:hypothetical protein